MRKSWGQVLVAIVMQIALFSLALTKLAGVLVRTEHWPPQWADAALLPAVLLSAFVTWRIFSRSIFILESEAAKVKIPLGEISYVLVPFSLVLMANVLFVRSLLPSKTREEMGPGLATPISPSTAVSICRNCGGALPKEEKSCPVCGTPRPA